MDDAMTWLVLAPGLLAIVGVSAWLAVIDWREHRLPNRIVGPLAAGVAVWLVLLGAASGDYGRAVGSAGWGCAGFFVFFVVHLAAGLGMGDVKYAWPACATLGWFGWTSVRIALLVLLASGGVIGIVVQLRGKGGGHDIAYGPLMAAALVCGIARGVVAS